MPLVSPRSISRRWQKTLPLTVRHSSHRGTCLGEESQGAFRFLGGSVVSHEMITNDMLIRLGAQSVKDSHQKR